MSLYSLHFCVKDWWSQNFRVLVMLFLASRYLNPLTVFSNCEPGG